MKTAKESEVIMNEIAELLKGQPMEMKIRIKDLLTGAALAESKVQEKKEEKNVEQTKKETPVA